MRKERRKLPTVRELKELLGRVSVRVINRFPESRQCGEWRDWEAVDDLKGTIVLSRDVHRSEGMMNALVLSGLHELVHAYFGIKCRDDRLHHDKVYRWELDLFKSPELRDAMAIRIGNAYIYGIEEP